MSFAKVAPEFDRFLENFIHYELTKDEHPQSVAQSAANNDLYSSIHNSYILQNLQMQQAAAQIAQHQQLQLLQHQQQATLEYNSSMSTISDTSSTSGSGISHQSSGYQSRPSVIVSNHSL